MLCVCGVTHGDGVWLSGVGVGGELLNRNVVEMLVRETSGVGAARSVDKTAPA